MTELKHVITFDSKDNIFIATSLEFPDIKTHGKTKEDALRELNVVISSLMDSDE